MPLSIPGKPHSGVELLLATHHSSTKFRTEGGLSPGVRSGGHAAMTPDG
jgi:hypothetical protein